MERAEILELVLDALGVLELRNDADLALAPASLDIGLVEKNGEGGTPSKHRFIEFPVTQAVIYGWYDNELGSYSNMLGDLTSSIGAKMYG